LKGFTLIELIMTMLIAGVLIGISIYGWQHFVITNQQTATINRLIGEIYFARSEAIKRNVNVVLCPSADRQHCGGQWNDSHIISIINANLLNIHDHPKTSSHFNSATVLRQYPPLPKGITLRLQSFGNSQMIKFTPYGFLNVQNGTFIFCPLNRDLHYAKAIIMNKLGRIRLSQDNDKDGIDENAEGKQLVC